MNHSQYEAYFKDEIAAKCPEIAHTEVSKRFSLMTIEEVFAAVATDLKMSNFCLVLDRYEGQLTLQNIDNPHKNIRGAFQVLKRWDNDRKTKAALLDEAERIGMKIITKMLHDAAQRLFFKNLEYSDVPMIEVGPILDNCFGVRFEFMLYEQQNLVYQPSEWL